MLVSDMSKAIRVFFLSLSVLLVTRPLSSTETTGAGLPPATENPEEVGTGDQWLDAVRAQRRSWEDRRRASREAMEAHRRQLSSRAEVQSESRHLEQQRRHEAFLEQIERDRDLFRSQGPWQTQAPPALPDTMEIPNPSHPHLTGWDNRWYFRGY